MRALTRAVMNEPEFQKVLNAIDSGVSPVLFSGLGHVHKAQAAACLSESSERPVIIIAPDDAEAKRLAADTAALLGVEVPVLASRDFTFYNAEGVSRSAEHSRLGLMYRMLTDCPPAVVITLDGLIERTIPPELLELSAMELKMGGSYDLGEICARLISAGYSRAEQVEGPGQFALRGGILDFFSPAQTRPVRCEFFGDELDSMGEFEVQSQRRAEVLNSALILPSSETLINLAPGGAAGLADSMQALLKKISRRKTTLPQLVQTIESDIERVLSGRTFPAVDRYIDLVYDFATAADYIPMDAVVVMTEPARLAERAKNYHWSLAEDISSLLESGVIESSIARFAMDWENVTAKLADFALLMTDNFAASCYPIPPKMVSYLTAKQLPAYAGSLDTAASDIEHYLNTGYAVLVLAQDERRARLLSEFLAERNIKSALDLTLSEMPQKSQLIITVGALSGGAEYTDGRIAVITEGQIAGGNFRKKAKKRKAAGSKLESFADLNPGDLVVHEHYGIGRFVGVVKMPVDKVEKDYVKIAYAGTDSLYVPATQLDLVSKYIGSGEDKPMKLSKMGGTDWARAKTRTKGAVKELAKGLLALQAERKREVGFAFSPDSEWQKDFEDAFQYEETDDQLRSINEIKKDMQNPMPMDRLLCGDVGYGKTEVALRAVMKCVLDGKQAAILVPTTVLAQQHFVTATKRFSSYPVRIEVLSRFRTPRQMKESIKNAADGTADIIIGTHRLLQKDLSFKNLGLLVVDEEQRFGVAHKERLKEMSRGVDVLTLSATPIPRTLNMALSGVRDMSTIEEPPQDRQPVQTYVMEHDWSVIADAIRREIGRGGQVYYLHNRVENIERTAARISEMLDGVNVAVGHGKMSEDELGGVMQAMTEGEVQVLVCTTIIETGIDIPNVNTLIIEDADKLGLAQLHQIRGRVGRSSRRAFAYLTFRQGKSLTEVANKRLSAIREFAEFNSGFKIAMRDLEIRGAGNILGPEQSGHMMSVGYDMYLKLLEEAVLEEKGEKPQVRTECSADLTVSAYIPESYVPSGAQRMDLYRRIAHIRTESDADDITDELIDRYGDPPKCVNTLLYIALMRGEAAAAGITEVAQKGGRLMFKLSDFDMGQISALYEMPEYKGIVKIEAGAVPAISLKLKSGGDVTAQAIKLIRAYAAAAQSAEKS